MTQQATHEEKMDELRQKYEQKLVTLQASHDKIVATKSAQFETIQKKMVCYNNPVIKVTVSSSGVKCMFPSHNSLCTCMYTYSLSYRKRIPSW